MKNILAAILLYCSFGTAAQTGTIERCELSYDSVGYCIDGKIVIDYIYQQGSEFYGDAAAVMNRRHKCALINKEGKEITAFIYDELVSCYYFPTYFAYKLGNYVGLIDDKGKEVFPFKYDSKYFQWDFQVDGGAAYYDSSNIFVFAQNGRYAALNCFGKPITDFIYEHIDVNYMWYVDKKVAEVIVVKKNGKVKLMHTNGKIEDKYQYDAFLGFWGHDCVFRKGKKIKFFNAETWRIVKTHLDEDGFITARIFEAEENGKKGLVDSIGRIIIPIIYDGIQSIQIPKDISKFIIAVQNNNKWGVRSGEDKELISMLYDEVSSICFGVQNMIKVKQNEKWAMFDMGTKLSEFKYDNMGCQSDKSAYIEIGDKKGELFFDGKEVWK